MGLFNRKTSKNQPADAYHEIVCMNTACMKRFTHDQRVFQLDPPQEVDDYRRSKMLNVSFGDEGRGFSTVRPERKPARTFYDLDDDDDEAEADSPPSAPSAPANRTQSEMEEKIAYYYVGEGDMPRCVTISEIAAPNRLYLKNDPATRFVVGVKDQYNNKTIRAVCPYCGMRLYPDAGLNEVMIVPVLGVSQSGKSVLLSNALAPFLKRYVNLMLPNGNMDQNKDVRKYIYDLEESIRKTSAAPATNAVKRLMWTIDSSERRVALFTFDMPGEYIANDSEGYRRFRELDVANVLGNASGLIIIVCPEQIERISDYNLDDDEDDARARQMRRMEDMIRLLCSEVDPQQMLVSKKLPTCVVLTKLDMLKDDYKGAVDITRIRDGAIRREVNDLITRPAIDVASNRVDMGPLDNSSLVTRGVFEKLFPNEMNMIITRLIGDRNMLGCFAVSAQGSDQHTDLNAAPIRPYDPFHWLFTKMNLFKRKDVKEYASENNKRKQR